jgi:CheY-like chemotaxis protein/HPt (histidine-containing phosphotransfer) domain-containing protein
MKYILDTEFEKLRKEFIENLNGDLGDLEDLIVGIPKSNAPSALLASVMGKIHSIKGVAGSYDFQAVSTICHIIEDHLIHSKIADSGNWEKITDLLLKDIDDLKTLVLALVENDGAQIEIIQNKYKLRNGDSESIPEKPDDKLRVLIVESSQILAKIVGETISKMNVEFAFAKNAYEALGRLLEEQYDVLITSHITNSLSGLSLINTIRLNQGLNRNIKTILISSNEFESIKGDFPFRPDYFLKKDLKLTGELVNIFNVICNKTDCVAAVDNVNDSKRRILLIDDSADIHKLVEISIKKVKNIELRSAKSTDEAINILSEFKPDLILLDVHLDKEDGRECFLKIKSKREFAKLKIVFLTGITEEKEISELFKMGASDVLKKPFDLKSLKSKIIQNVGLVAS